MKKCINCKYEMSEGIAVDGLLESECPECGSVCIESLPIEVDKKLMNGIERAISVNTNSNNDPMPLNTEGLRSDLYILMANIIVSMR